MLTGDVDELIERSAAPVAARRAVERIAAEHPGAAERLATDVPLATAIVAVTGASRHLARLVEADPTTLAVLSDLDLRRPVDHGTVHDLHRWKEHEYLRIAARDLLGIDGLEATVAAISALAADVLAGADALASGPDEGGRRAGRDRHGQAGRQRARTTPATST